MNNIKELYERNIKLFSDLQIEYELFQHRPITDYETDLAVAKEFNWTAVPSKSLFLKEKNGYFCLFITHRDSRLDSKKLKSLLGKKVSVCSNEVLTEQTGFVAGAVCPFVIPKDIKIIFDGILLNYEQVMFTPADPEYTVIINSSDLIGIFENMGNELYFYSKTDE